jgi:hypothetical protein
MRRQQTNLEPKDTQISHFLFLVDHHVLRKKLGSVLSVVGYRALVVHLCYASVMSLESNDLFKCHAMLCGAVPCYAVIIAHLSRPSPSRKPSSFTTSASSGTRSILAIKAAQVEEVEIWQAPLHARSRP